MYPQPVRRSKLRLLVGKRYYMCKKYRERYLSGRQYATVLDTAKRRPHEVFAHQSVLLRKLDGVAMQLQHNKVTNLRLAVQRLHGLVLAPGETMSYRRLLGHPTAAKGYLPGVVLRDGMLQEGVGGGLCQLSNLLFWMTLHTPLTVVERWRHSYDVFPDVRRTQPFGTGATCAYPAIDLQIRNDTGESFQLFVMVGATHLQGKRLSSGPCDCSYELEEVEHRFEQQMWGGYTRHNRVVRRCYDEVGALLREEVVLVNNAIMMYCPMLD